jgi:DNA recombination protein RmuC
MNNEIINYLFIGLLALFIGVIISYFWTKFRFKQRVLENQLANNDKYRLLENTLKEKEQFFEKEKNDLLKSFLDEKQNLEKQYNSLEKQNLQEKSEFEILIAGLQNDIKNWEEKWQLLKDDFKKNETLLQEKFENLAQKILEEKSKKFTEQNQQNIDRILTPFKDEMKSFKQKVEDTDKESLARHRELYVQLRNLKELNQQLSQDALNLTKALKGESKTQGIWGETILNRLLEKSGLEKGREYFTQQSYQASEDSTRTRLQPDVVIQLPDNKKMVIDAKVSLTAYEKYSNEDDENQTKTYLKQHILSLKTHINGLSKKSYDALLEGESPEFILMFIPIEPAFSAALREEPELYQYAFERNIVLVTPTTLLATLKIVDNMWRNEKQRQNATEIAKQAGNLYDKFHGLLADIEQIGKRIENAQQSYDAAMNKLSTGKGNLISRVEKLKTLGAKAKKQLPQANQDEE